jgi:hypothetical protein
MKMASVLAVVAGAAFAGVAAADFTGDYAPANWTLDTNGNGFVQQHDASTLVLVGSDAGSLGFEYADLIVTVPTGGTISFDWSYSSTDAPGFDAGFYFAGGFVFLSDTNGDSGTVTGVSVGSGDLFAFSVESTDGLFDPGVLTITNFNYVPAPGALAVLGLAGFAARRRRA